LPPGVYSNQRSIDDKSKRLDLLLKSVEALDRILLSDASSAGVPTNGTEEKDELANLGFNIKSKKSQKQKKKQATSGYMTEREEQQLRDIETISKAGLDIPVLEGERQELKEKVTLDLLSIYKVSNESALRIYA